MAFRRNILVTGTRIAITVASLYLPLSAFALVAESRTSPNDTSPTLTPSTPPVDMLRRVLNYQAEPLIAQRQRFIEAEKALAHGPLTRYRELSRQLTDYPLYPYLQYQDLKRRQRVASDEEIHQFLTTYADLPLANTLRQRVLRRAAKRGDWQAYLRFYQPPQSVTLQCHYLYARLQTEPAEAVSPQIEKLWLDGRSRPQACDRVFAQWREAGYLSDALLWQRLELVLEKGRTRLAGYLARQLPAKERRWAQLWIGLQRYPEQLLRRHRQLLKPHPKATRIFVTTLQRLARRDPQRAIDFLERLSPQHPLAEADRYAVYRSIALSLALAHQADAEDWFTRIPPSYQTEASYQWRVRAAIRESRWETVLTAIQALPAASQGKDRWRYWQARALNHLDRKSEARAIFTELAGHRNYYGFLAADRLSLPYPMRAQTYQTTAAELFGVLETPGIRRARELFQLGRRVEARREWRNATADLGETERQQASKLAQLWGWYGQSILTMASTTNRDDLELRFPLLFKDEVLSLSQHKGLEPAWTYGVIRRESAFISDARSTKGALGLMQLMPATARSISRTLNIRYQDKRQLLRPETNLTLGTGHLAKMLKRFNQQTVLATAAYNAGAQRVKKWLPEDSAMEADRWIETIPYKETREYVSNVLAYTVIYSNRLGSGGPRLYERMPAIPSRF